MMMEKYSTFDMGLPLLQHFKDISRVLSLGQDLWLQWSEHWPLFSSFSCTRVCWLLATAVAPPSPPCSASLHHLSSVQLTAAGENNRQHHREIYYFNHFEKLPWKWVKHILSIKLTILNPATNSWWMPLNYWTLLQRVLTSNIPG